MGGYLLLGFTHALIMTGALNQDASKRFAETAKWGMDCTEYGGLERFGAGFKSTLHVRFIHGLVRRSLAANPKWDVGQWGTSISQIDMAATYIATVAVAVNLGGDTTMQVSRKPEIMAAAYAIFTSTKGSVTGEAFCFKRSHDGLWWSDRESAIIRALFDFSMRYGMGSIFIVCSIAYR